MIKTLYSVEVQTHTHISKSKICIHASSMKIIECISLSL